MVYDICTICHCYIIYEWYMSLEYGKSNFNGVHVSQKKEVGLISILVLNSTKKVIILENLL